MSDRFRKLSARLFQQRSNRFWHNATENAESLDLGALRALRRNARETRRKLDQLLFLADGRLTLPLIGTNVIEKPLHSDWAYRPKLWRGPVANAGFVAFQNKTPIGDEIAVCHDCKLSELSVRQIRNTGDKDLAPFGLQMDVFGFAGSFLSLVIDLPKPSVADLQKSHVLRLAAVVEMERPQEAFARLNIKNGPNTEQIVRELPLNSDDVSVEFDLAYTKINEKRIEKMWVDLIFESPEMNQIVLRDISFSRRPRAEM